MIESLSIDEGVFPMRYSFKSMLLRSWAVGEPAGNLPVIPYEPPLQEIGEPRKCLAKEAGLKVPDDEPVYEPPSVMA